MRRVLREIDTRRRRAVVALLVLLPYLAIVGVGSLAFNKVRAERRVRVAQINTRDALQCRRLDALQSAIVKTVRDGDARVDSFAYYRQHPDEAAIVHRQNAEVIARFSTPACKGAPTVAP